MDTDRNRCVRKWLVSMLLTAPLFIVYLLHFLSGGPDRIPTGFIQLDQPFYMAMAREYFDSGHFSLFYSYPFMPEYDLPRIYFQPQTFLLGMVWRMTGADPGRLMFIFHLVCAVVFVRVAMALYERVVGLTTGIRWLGLTLFVWGGGVLCLSGIGHELLIGHSPTTSLFNAFKFDPVNGWWFLNLGRNMFLPFEAYYHVLSLGSVVAVLHRRYIIAVGLCLLLCLSSPFSGPEFVLIWAAWALFEIVFIRRSAVPWWFLLGVFAVGAVFAAQMAWLNSFPVHVVARGTYEGHMTDLFHARTFIPAYLLVGLMALGQFRTLGRARAFFSQSQNRLFFVWAVVAFALANHELVVKPLQPMHFTRGYVWTPLFLMGWRTLTDLLEWIRFRRTPFVRYFIYAGVCMLLLFDNALWVSALCFERAVLRRNRGDYVISKAEKDLLTWLSHAPAVESSVAISPDRTLNVLIPCYAPLRCWTTSTAQTPEFEERERELDGLFRQGQVIEKWKSIRMVLISSADDHKAADAFRGAGLAVQGLYTNSAFAVYLCESVQATGLR
jgi:hypothetical protein